MRIWISSVKVFCIGGATSYSPRGLCSSGVSDCVNTGGELGTSSLAGANDAFSMILLRVVAAVGRLHVVVGVGMVEGVGK